MWKMSEADDMIEECLPGCTGQMFNSNRDTDMTKVGMPSNRDIANRDHKMLLDSIPVLCVVIMMLLILFLCVVIVVIKMLLTLFLCVVIKMLPTLFLCVVIKRLLTLFLCVNPRLGGLKTRKYTEVREEYVVERIPYFFSVLHLLKSLHMQHLDDGLFTDSRSSVLGDRTNYNGVLLADMTKADLVKRFAMPSIGDIADRVIKMLHINILFLCVAIKVLLTLFLCVNPRLGGLKTRKYTEVKVEYVVEQILDFLLAWRRVFHLVKSFLMQLLDDGLFTDSRSSVLGDRNGGVIFSTIYNGVFPTDMTKTDSVKRFGIRSMGEIADSVSKMLLTNILWVNPDCGLKTCKYTEVKPALQNMGADAKLLRTQLASTKWMVQAMDVV